MARLRIHPLRVTLLALVVAAVAVAAIAGAFGFASFASAWLHPHPGWLGLCFGGEVLALAAYAVCYRALARLEGGPDVPVPLLARVIVAGFGPFAAGGGFSLDKRALHALEGDEEAATVRVIGLGALEWALLAPAAWVSAVVILLVSDHRPMPSLVWPWAVAVPVGFALALPLTTARRRERLAAGRGRWRPALGRALRGAGMLLSLSSELSSCWAAWAGGALYWALDIGAFYGAIRFIGLRPNGAEVILAYATGYALTRRSIPLGGAGVTEVLMTFSLHWAGQAVAPALAAVVVYRFFNFALPAGPALLLRGHIHPLLRGTPAQRRAAAARLGWLRR